ncbi:SRPBCC family protein [Saccharibacillus sp. JS10]|uniref:SRPBCC family protein n=1 Tax=Saccharibacillus sp. JS10 TaxID=2950552 RepID=UPI00210EB38E|nr:SRPBCC family protein [Saccharibacillus sp. JS10]MCQ4087847.1 SRPBCC family protein [Saccharibacillus sp. JS10]
MLAVIESNGKGYKARFERRLTSPIEQVWAYLTDNERLKQWLPELYIKELHLGGAIQFDMQDGTFEELRIVGFKESSMLEYTWGEDRIRFELRAKQYGSHLVLVETIRQITSYTPKDLAGWHVCLDTIEALMDGRKIESRKENWEKWFGEYRTLVETRV